MVEGGVLYVTRFNSSIKVVSDNSFKDVAVVDFKSGMEPQAGCCFACVFRVDGCVFINDCVFTMDGVCVCISHFS